MGWRKERCSSLLKWLGSSLTGRVDQTAEIRGTVERQQNHVHCLCCFAADTQVKLKNRPLLQECSWLLRPTKSFVTLRVEQSIYFSSDKSKWNRTNYSINRHWTRLKINRCSIACTTFCNNTILSTRICSIWIATMTPAILSSLDRYRFGNALLVIRRKTAIDGFISVEPYWYLNS